MTKSSESQQARRVNATVSLLNQKASASEVLSWLMNRYGISRRQAYRYFRQAQAVQGPVAIPEAKRVFTVKLPESLIGQVRRQARLQGGTISQWVEAALRRSLNAPQSHG